MSLPRWVPGALLLVAAATSSLALWWLYRQDEPEPLTGPPRSDYFLSDFDLVALDSGGKESFHVTGPYLSRHPYLGTIEIEQPRFALPDSREGTWLARADRAWVDAGGTELRLIGAVALDSPPEGGSGELAFRSERLDVFPRERKVQSDAVVTLTSRDSILRGRGLRADLDTRRFQLLDEVTGHYASPVSTPRR